MTRRKSSLTEEEQEVSKFRDYFDLVVKIDKIPSHRLLAILRGVNEDAITAKIEVEERGVLAILRRELYPEERREIPHSNREQVEEAIEDSYKRLLHPSVENEIFRLAKERADLEAVTVFGTNLTDLLLAPPIGQKRILAIDPGFRTGCKVVCLDAQGELLHNETIYPHPPVSDKIGSIKKLTNMIEAYKIEVIAIGDGTASRETEAFIKKIAMPEGMQIYSVSEDGASIYSASPVAREEFPDYDVTVRGAVSIGRRAMDPLAELVKIDPKSLGIGQYQHDVDQNLLKERLDSVVISCVNRVGVNLNTASKHLLSYVSGLGPVTAQNIVDYRATNGPFSSKRELLEVKRIGPKVFEQSAGFLRVPGGENPLDNTAVHPERYALVEQIASDLGGTPHQLIGEGTLRDQIVIDNYISDSVGRPTLVDIVDELARPGLDPRGKVKVLEFSDEIYSIEDLKEGMIVPGIVTNITKFGAFVNIGIKEDGLVHISQLADRFVKDPSDVVKLHQHVKVKVLDVDLRRGRIGLSMKGLN